MQPTYAAQPSRLRPPALALALALLGLLLAPMPAPAESKPDAIAAAGWHGRAIQDPKPKPPVANAEWPKGWSAGSVGPGTGYHRPGGSEHRSSR